MILLRQPHYRRLCEKRQTSLKVPGILPVDLFCYGVSFF